MSSAVIGSGAWGKALAGLFDVGQIVKARGEAVEIKADYIFVATEAQKLREVIGKHQISAKAKLVICAKGIEQDSLKLMGEVVEEILPGNKYLVLSGPNFADEIVDGMPAAATIACADEMVGKEFIRRFAKPNFRLYYSDDVVATQIGGAVKNVIAIAAGVAIGLKLGENARAAIITRGMAEVVQLAVAKGGRIETLMGLSGFGDMILTATSANSRNTAFGIQITQRHPALVAGFGLSITDNNGFANRTPQQARDDNSYGGVVEGYYTAKSVYELAEKLNVEMPICFSVYDILYKGKDINEVVDDLLKRPQG